MFRLDVQAGPVFVFVYNLTDWEAWDTIVLPPSIFRVAPPAVVWRCDSDCMPLLKHALSHGTPLTVTMLKKICGMLGLRVPPNAVKQTVVEILSLSVFPDVTDEARKATLAKLVDGLNTDELDEEDGPDGSGVLGRVGGGQCEGVPAVRGSSEATGPETKVRHQAVARSLPT